MIWKESNNKNQQNNLPQFGDDAHKKKATDWIWCPICTYDNTYFNYTKQDCTLVVYLQFEEGERGEAIISHNRDYRLPEMQRKHKKKHERQQ